MNETVVIPVSSQTQIYSSLQLHSHQTKQTGREEEIESEVERAMCAFLCKLFCLAINARENEKERDL